jgi:hypothetical protein
MRENSHYFELNYFLNFQSLMKYIIVRVSKCIWTFFLQRYIFCEVFFFPASYCFFNMHHLRQYLLNTCIILFLFKATAPKVPLSVFAVSGGCQFCFYGCPAFVWTLHLVSVTDFGVILKNLVLYDFFLWLVILTCVLPLRLITVWYLYHYSFLTNLTNTAPWGSGLE